MQKENKKQPNWKDVLRRFIGGRGGRAADKPEKTYTTGKDKKDRMAFLLEKIYKEVIYFEDDIVQMENGLAVDVEELLSSYPEKLSEKQKEQFRAVIYEAVLATEAKTFWLGVRYAYKMAKLL